MTKFQAEQERVEEFLDFLEHCDNEEFNWPSSDLNEFKKCVLIVKYPCLALSNSLSNAQSCNVEKLNLALDCADKFVADVRNNIAFSPNSIEPIISSLMPSSFVLAELVSAVIRSLKKFEQVAFFFRVIEGNETCYTRPIIYKHNDRNNLSGILSDRVLKGKTLNLFANIIIPDHNLYISQEPSAQDPSKFVYFIMLKGQKLAEINPNTEATSYDIIIAPLENDFVQPLKFVRRLQNPAQDLMVVRVDHFESGGNGDLSHMIIEGSASEIVDRLNQLEPKSIKVIQRNPEYQIVPTSFDGNPLTSLNLAYLNEDNTTGAPIPLTNFMWFQVETSRDSEALYECLRAKLTSTGERQLDIVRKHLKKLSEICGEGKNVYARFVALVQSSGFGKSKICIELLLTQPGLYLVFRDQDQAGIPHSADWMNDFSNYIFGAEHDELPLDEKSFLAANAIQYTPGRFLIALSILLEAYKSQLKELIQASNEPNDSEKVKKAFEKLTEAYFTDPSTSNGGSKFVFPNNFSMTVRQVRDKIHGLISFILKCTGNSGPFLFFLDEADVLNGRNPKGRLSGINVIRRGLHLLKVNTNILTVAIGTNSDALDFTPAVHDNSLRYIKRKYVLPSFMLTRNWDIMSEQFKLDLVEIRPELLLNLRYFNILVTMGRALWSSIELSQVVSVARAKLVNGDEQCVAALIARLLVRANLSVNVHHVLSRSLVRSYMVIVNYISTDARTMKIGYSSEPILAFAARKLLKDNDERENSFRALKQMLEHGAIDKGRVVEFIFEQISLFAIDDANMEDDGFTFRDIVDANVPTEIQECCKVTTRILEIKNQSSEHANHSSEEYPSSDIKVDYRVISVNVYLRTKFGKEAFSFIKKSLSPAVLNGLINISQFIQLETTDKDDFKNFKEVQGTRSPLIIDRSLLKCGVMRFCGFVMPPGYYGIDYIIPFILDDPERKFSRPVYSFIAIQSKTSLPSSVDQCAIKMIAPRHLLRCCNPDHRNCCNSQIHASCFTAEELDFICKNQVTILLSAKHDLKRGLPSTRITLVDQKLDEVRIKTAAGLKRTALEMGGELSKKDLKMIDDEAKRKFVEKVIKKAVKFKYGTTELNVGNRVSVYKYPSFKEKIHGPLPDFISNQRINRSISLQRMVWKRKKKSEDHKSILCISCNDLRAFENLVGRNTLAVMREIIDLESSNLHCVEPIHRPVVQDSLLNGTFSPYEEMNPLLRKMRGLRDLPDPLAGYHETTFSISHWTRSIKQAAVGPVNAVLPVQKNDNADTELRREMEAITINPEEEVENEEDEVIGMMQIEENTDQEEEEDDEDEEDEKYMDTD